MLVERILHGQADIIGKFPDVQPLDIARTLNAEDNQSIEQAEHIHIRCRSGAAEDIIEILGQLPVEPGTGNHANIVHNAADCDDEQ